MTTITEWCPNCACQRGVLEVEDEPYEDCNYWATVKEYRIIQKTTEAKTCDCGARLSLHLDGTDCPTHPAKRKKPPPIVSNVPVSCE